MGEGVTAGSGISEAEVAAARAAGVEPHNVGLAVLTAVREYGVDTVFGIPGTHNLEFYRHLRRLGMRAVTSRHEQGAGYAADGWAQRTGLPGVVLTTSGPGVLNALSAAGTAYCESRPLLILAPGVPRGAEFADIGSLHETKDQVTAVGAIVEWARRVHSAEEALEAVHDAFELFRTSRPRPVYIEIPLDLLEGPAEVDAALLRPRAISPTGIVDERALDNAVAVLAAATRPAILAGSGAIGARDSLQRLAEVLGAPVVTSLNGKGVIPESHPLALGSDLRLESARTVLNEADVLCIIGSKVGESELWGGAVAPRGDVIRVDLLDTQLQKNVPSAYPLRGDARVVLPELLERLARAGVVEPRAPHLDVPAVRAAAASEAADFAPVEYTLAGRIAAVLPDNAIVSGDSSQITYYGMTSQVRSLEPHSFLYMAAYATLGYGLPAAIGAKVASPDRPVVGVIGDGALMFSVQEFQTAVEQGLDLTIVCVDNGGYGEIQQNERDRGIDPIGVQLAQPNWPKLVEAFGGTGFAVTAEAELEPRLRDALVTPGLTLVHVPLALFAH